MTTKGREDAGKLNADDAAADNQNLLGKGICLGAVSYTHLDVYKRQTQTRIINKNK